MAAKLLKDGGKAWRVALTELYNDILKPDAEIPKYWKQTRLKVLFKSGDPQLPENYRPISILPVLYKLFSRIVCARIKDVLLSAQSCDQSGFRPGYCCDDHLFAVSLVAEKMNEFGQPLWVTAVDFKKAFDTVSHCSLWRSLIEQGVPMINVQNLQKLYFDQEGYVQNDRRSRTFRINWGTKQGDPISPILFNAALETAMARAKEKWFKEKWGIQVGHVKLLTNLRFADDVLLMGRSLFQVREMLEDLIRGAKEVGLEIYPEKTMVLNNGKGQCQAARSINAAGGTVKVLARDESTKYLGRLLNLCEPNDVEIDFRIKRAWAKFAVYREELTDKHYSLFQRLRMFNAVVMPTALYGAGSWAMTASREKSLRTAQRKMLRSILGKGRQRTEPSGSEVSYEVGDVAWDDDECLETWVQWKQRTTREA